MRNGLLARGIRPGLWLALGCHGPPLALHAYCISGLGLWSLPGVELFVFLVVLCLLVALACLPLALWSTARPAALRLAFACAVVVLLWPPSVILQGWVRKQGFHLAATRAEPLIRAIEQYSLDHGTPPASISDVVPEYLPAMPSGLPPLELISGDELTARYYSAYGNPWILYSVVSTGILNWDQFMYFPLQNYPRLDYGGWLEPIGEWAYVHE